ncbi:MMPL family transporter [Thermoleophilia bacterium SCSIO 60948]|nr:MMPL family transporter [Thermoleophilia bacterium SCSIO 60948]
MLSLLGRRIDSLRLPVGHKPHDDRPHGWARWAETVTRHPVVCLIAGFAILIALAIPVGSLTLGQQDNGALPKDTESRQSYDIVRGGFGAGANGTILVSVDLEKPAKNDQASLNQLDQKQQRQKQQAEQQAQQQEQQQVAQLTEQLEGEGIPPDEASEQAQEQVSAQAPPAPGPSAAQQRKLDKQRKYLRSPESDPRLVSLRKKIERTDDVDQVSPPLVNKAGDAAVLTVVATSAPSSPRTADLVETLRDDVLPKATAGNDETASVGGLTASYVDLATQITGRLPLVIGLVLLLTFIVLMLAFRSLLVPLKAVVMNAFSIAAAFGVVSFVFSNDWTARLVGLEGAVPIVSYVPLMMFAILFGLSMDYEVFLMSHVREGWMATSDAREAIVHGVAGTARVITSAALIMVSVFCAFVISGDPTIKQFGVGMAVAVAVDATIVRCLLVPAILELLGRSAWYMPAWLDRALPRISVEGDPDAGR